LYTYGLVLLYLTLGLYVLTAAGFAAQRFSKKEPLLEGVSDFHEVAGIWAERNLLLRNVIWPRSAHVETLPLEPTVVRIPRATTREIATQFDSADKDRDGKISLDELNAFFEKHPLLRSYPAYKRKNLAGVVMAKLDYDRDGTLSA